MPSRERCVHRGCGLLPHPRHHVAVAIQRHRHRSVAEKLLNQSRVRPLGEQQRGAGVAQIVKPRSGRQPRAGEQRLDRHRVYAKGGPYEESQGIPFVVRGPGVQRGVVSDKLVANIDLAPTIAQWAGIQPPEYVDGRSLVPLLEGTARRWRQYLLFEYDDSRLPYGAVRTTGGETYAEHGSGEKEYYDLAADRWQVNSTHSAPKNAQRIGELSAILSELKGCAKESCRSADGGP
jgi:hypothetical protein